MNAALCATLALLWSMPPKAGVTLSANAWQRYGELGLNQSRGFARTTTGNIQIQTVSGTRRFPVVFMSYSDVGAEYDASDFQAMLFDGPWTSGSAHDYYEEVSYGKVDLRGQVVGPYPAKYTASYYADDNYGIGNNYARSAGALVLEACQASDASVDYSLYDNDGDGYVDIFTVIHVGYGAEETGITGDIWSHEFSLSGWASYGGPGVYETNDADPNHPGQKIKIDVYTINPERSSESVDGTISSIGVFCHEWGHGFGLPDLYITDGPSSGSAGLGIFCLMASGSWGGTPAGSSPVHPSAWCKYLLGWVEPQSLERGALEEVDAAEFAESNSSASAWRIFANPSGAEWSFEKAGIGEYFLAENRRRKGFDKGLPGDGLLVLHVDESQENNNNLSNPLVGIMQADGSPQFLFTSGQGSASDLWKSDSFGFSNSSVPSSRFYDGVPSGASVSLISEADSIMTARLEIAALLLGRTYSYPNPFNAHEREKVTIVYEPTDEEKTQGQYPDFKVYIYNLAGERVRVLDEKPAEISVYGRVAYWDGRNDGKKPVASGLYFYIIETYENGLVKERSKSTLTLVR
ncbi:M6 family metalloprotease domain-containing protein [bacterium]|nr:M6 family metalloprotease domain-containing protein [bacterium]